MKKSVSSQFSTYLAARSTEALADALRGEASELARSANFAPPLISSNIDALLALARCHNPGPAEQLLEQTVADTAATGGWHQWL